MEGITNQLVIINHLKLNPSHFISRIVVEEIELERTNVMIILLVVKVKLEQHKLKNAMKKHVRQIGLSALSDRKKKVEQDSSKFFIQMELMVTARVNLKARKISYQIIFSGF